MCCSMQTQPVSYSWISIQEVASLQSHPVVLTKSCFMGTNVFRQDQCCSCWQHRKTWGCLTPSHEWVLPEAAPRATAIIPATHCVLWSQRPNTQMVNLRKSKCWILDCGTPILKWVLEEKQREQTSRFNHLRRWSHSDKISSINHIQDRFAYANLMNGAQLMDKQTLHLLWIDLSEDE